MRIIQIYWSKPAFDLVSIHHNGGWLEMKYHYISLCLSCLLLKEWGKELSLITDERGKSLLIDQLGLPYDHVSTELEDFADFPSDLGMMVRLSCFRQQKSHFLFIDGDVFVNGRPDNSIWTSKIIVQQEIHLGSEEAGKLLELLRSLGKKSDPALGDRNPFGPVRGFEQGVFGGTDLSTLSAYAGETLDFFYGNIDHLLKVVAVAARDSTIYSNTAHPFDQAQAIVESHFLAGFLQRKAIRPYCAIPPQLANKHSHHLLGMTRHSGTVRVTPLNKRRQEFCDQLEFLFMRKFPDHYFLILSAIKEYCV